MNRFVSASSVAVLGVLASIASYAAPASADLSDRSKGTVWNLEHWVYLSDCRYDKPMPAEPDSYFVDACDHGYEQEERYLAMLTPAEKEDPRAKAVFEMHAKSAQYIAKVKAAHAAAGQRKQGEANDYEAFKKDAKANSEGLWFLYQLDKHQDSYLGNAVVQSDVESRVGKAMAVKAFGDKCAAKYAKMKVPYGGNEYLDDPVQTCAEAMNQSDILKREVPKLFPRMRALGAAASKKAREKIAGGQPVWQSEVACAETPAKCDAQEGQIERITRLLGLAATAANAPDPAAFAAAMKTATGKRRIGTFHDGTREGAVARALKSAGTAYQAMALFDANDHIEKNAFGIPKDRSREAGVLVKVAGESFCRAYTAVAFATYEGGGRYGQWQADIFEADKNTFVVSSCK